MNYDFFMGQLRIAAVAVIAFAGGKGWLSQADSSTVTALLPVIGALLGPWAWSIYRNLNMKLVPKDSVAIAPESVITSVNPAGGTALVHGTVTNGVDPQQKATIAAKIVGALILAFCLASLPRDALAQGTAPAGNCSLSLFKTIGPANFIKQLQQCGADDVKAATDDATAQKDQEALACLIPLSDVVSAVQTNAGKVGLVYATQKYRDAKKSGMITACVNYFNSTFLVP